MSLGYDDVIYQYHKQSEGVTVATVQEDSQELKEMIRLKNTKGGALSVNIIKGPLCLHH